MNQVTLREVVETDLPILFEQQLNPQANHMAAFTAKNPADRENFNTRWAKILNNPTGIVRTILYGEQVAGYVTHFEMFGDPAVAYWLGQEFWGKGIATQALAALLKEVKIRPLVARAAADNHGSIRVLQKCGFTIIGRDKAFAHGRDAETEEVIMELKA